MGLPAFQIDAAELSLEETFNVGGAPTAGGPVTTANLATSVPGYIGNTTGLSNQFLALPFASQISLLHTLSTSNAATPTTFTQLTLYRKLYSALSKNGLIGVANPGLQRIPLPGTQISNWDTADPFITPTGVPLGAGPATAQTIAAGLTGVHTIILSGVTLDGAGYPVGSAVFDVILGVNASTLTSVVGSGASVVGLTLLASQITVTGALSATAPQGVLATVQSAPATGAFTVTVTYAAAAGATNVTLRYLGASMTVNVTVL